MNDPETGKSDLRGGNLRTDQTLPIAIDVKSVHQNVSQRMIIVTEDKVRICLTEHLAKVEKRQSWLAPFGILGTTIITLVTADFTEKRFGLEGAAWQAIFVISAGLSVIWLIRSLLDLRGAVSLEDVISELKAEAKFDPSTVNSWFQVYEEMGATGRSMSYRPDTESSLLERLKAFELRNRSINK